MLAKRNPLLHCSNCSAQESPFVLGLVAAEEREDFQKEVLSWYGQVSVCIGSRGFEKTRFGVWKLGQTRMPNPSVLAGNNISMLWDSPKSPFAGLEAALITSCMYMGSEEKSLSVNVSYLGLL